MLNFNIKYTIKGEMMPKLSEGMKAPLINIPRDGGSKIDTSKINGAYIIYFYPKVNLNNLRIRSFDIISP